MDSPGHPRASHGSITGVGHSVWNSLDGLLKLGSPSRIKGCLEGYDFGVQALDVLFDRWFESASAEDAAAARMWSCRDYDRGAVTDGLAAMLGDTGLDRLVRSARTIAIKVALVEARDPDAHITPHPVVVECLIALLQRWASGARIVVADGSGHERDSRLLLKSCGIEEVLRRTGVEHVDLNCDDVVVVDVPAPLTFPSLALPATIRRADLIISLAKLKTHHWTGVTLGMKNLFGVLPGSIYGFPKNRLHWASYPRVIADIHAAVRPHLTIIDGIVGVEGNGPLDGRPKPAHALIAGASTLACDCVGAQLMGFSPLLIPQFWFAMLKGGETSSLKTAVSTARCPVEHRQWFQPPPGMPWLYGSADLARDQLVERARALLL